MKTPEPKNTYEDWLCPDWSNHDLILDVLSKIEDDIADISAIPKKLLDSGKPKTAIEVEMRIKASRA